MNKRETVNPADFNLPEHNPLLQERMKKHKIKDPSFQPIGDDCLAWRLPETDKTAGGLYIPDEAKSPRVRMLLLACGPAAMDYLYTNGIFPGHYVVVERFAGWEMHDQEAMAQNLANEKDEVVIIKAKTIKGSEELRRALKSGQAKMELGPDDRYVLNSKKMLNSRAQKLLALAESTTSPEEAETARRLAQETKE